ncbi:putative rho-gtpase-activating protein [Operophtera brumata]|uniref:Putative rho-gtpase-activating protein n=1 Tax=Operophtera brumata TaxID=104452 RepID=A0A0L7LQS8_OPEBR|nr:putative rho-gtpase-activating protein [Operophtera brumata]
MRTEHKPPPVVVLKRDCRDDDERERDRVDGLYSQHGTLRSTGGPGSSVRPVGDGREERGRLALGPMSPDSNAIDLYYNPRPSSDHSWSYRPPPPVITEQPKSSATHYVPYERSYPNTLDSLAEKVHSYYPQEGSTRFGGRVPRSGSEQQLPRAETHSDFGRHSLLRSSLKASAASGGLPSGLGDIGGNMGRTGLPSGLSSTGLSGLTGSSLVGSGLTSSGLGTGLSGTGLTSALGAGYGTTGLGLSSYSSKFGSARRNRSLGRLPSSPSIFTSDEYRSWLSRAPSTSAFRFGSSLGLARRIERPRHLPSRSVSSQQLGATAGGVGLAGGSPSARRVRQLLELGSRFNCPNPSPVPTPGSRHQRHLDFNPSEYTKYKVEKPSAGLSTSMTGLSRIGGRVSGMLWVHLLAGRGLRPGGAGSPSSPPGAPLSHRDPPVAPRDLYCVLECDRVHKARTVVRTGELQFDWDESFELELVDNRQLDVLVYSWDPQHRHKLLRHTEPPELFRRRGIVGRASPSLFGAELEAVVARECSRTDRHNPPVPLIVRRCVEEIERRGLDIIGLYRLCGSASKKRILREAFERNARSVELAPDSVPDINVITGLLKDYLRELPQPLFSRCLYQMTVDALGVCLPDDREGNARLMASIVECLPRAARATLVFLLDHLALVVAAQDRNKCLPWVARATLVFLLDHLALVVAAQDRNKVNNPSILTTSVMASIVECLPRAARATLVFLLDHLALVVAAQDRNKMSPQHLSVALAPPLMLHAQPAAELDYSRPIHVLQCLLQIWPAPKRSASPRGAASASAVPGRRQVTVSSPGSASSSEGSHSPADTIKHGGSVSSILRQPASPSRALSPRNSPRASPRDSPRSTPQGSAIPGTSAGLAVTLNTTGALSPRYNSSTNPFLQQYDAEAEAEAWRSADIFSTHA